MSHAPRLHEHRLTNGLRVVFRPSRTLPIATLDMWVRVGAADEPRAIAGASHFLEHMLFKGTPRLPVGEYDRRIEGLGGYLNAGTSYDYTHYYIEVPSANVAPALRDFADVLCASAIDPHEVASERLVILEEIRRKNDNPPGFLYDSIVASAWQDGPYSHPVLGFSETVAEMSADALRDHFQRFYAADNMTLVIAGDVEPVALLPLLEEAFAPLPRARRPHRAEPPAGVLRGEARTVWPREWKECYFYLAFPAPEATTAEDLVRCDLVDAILSSGRRSRLVAALREKKRLMSSVGAYMATHPFPSLCFVGGRCEAANLDAAVDAIHEEIATLVRDGLREGEEERVRRQVETGFVYGTQTNSDVASMLGWSHTMLGNDALYSRYRDMAISMNLDEAVAYVRRHLTPDSARLFATFKAA